MTAAAGPVAVARGALAAGARGARSLAAVGRRARTNTGESEHAPRMRGAGGAGVRGGTRGRRRK
eukprot:425984-Pyramimonas_sp.AAC.1